MTEHNPDPSTFTRSSGAVALRRSGYQTPGHPQLLGTDFSGVSTADKIQLLRGILEKKVHGISFSPYMDGQEPGIQISAEQIRERMSIIAPFTNWVRTFSTVEGNELAPQIAHEMGLKTMVGVGLTDDLEKNEMELAAGIEIARAGHADILAVGNEILLREDLTEDQLIDYIERAKAAVPGVPVSYVDAYFLFENHPRVADACDVLLVNCYPFWESCPAEFAVLYMKDMYRRAQSVANGKPVIVSETGWPTVGTPFGAAVPSFENALEYFIKTYQWAEQDEVDVFYFSSFDESWKVGDEGDVGAYWGLWDTKGQLKYV
ncbi:MAG: glycosyl hydrolase family 17 protein [Gammaproteobacteria bacterium]